MTAKQVIYTDGRELILLLKTGTGREPVNYLSDQVQHISFSYLEGGLLHKLLKKKDRRITVVVKGLTVTFDESDHKQWFDTYVKDLRDYCTRNRVTFVDFPE